MKNPTAGHYPLGDATLEKICRPMMDVMEYVIDSIFKNIAQSFRPPYRLFRCVCSVVLR